MIKTSIESILPFTLYKRIIKIYCSCSTAEQIKVADRYTQLAIFYFTRSSYNSKIHRRMANTYILYLKNEAVIYSERMKDKIKEIRRYILESDIINTLIEQIVVLELTDTYIIFRRLGTDSVRMESIKDFLSKFFDIHEDKIK